MVVIKFEFERFDGRIDFGIWRQRMKAILVQMKVSKALEGKHAFPKSMKEFEVEEALELAYSTIILNLGDKVLREVQGLSTALDVWNKLDQLYMSKSLTNRIHLKDKLFSFRMVETKTLQENLDEFLKLTIELSNLGIEIDSEDLAIVLLNSLPMSFLNFIATIKFSKETLSFDEVLVSLKTKVFDSSVQEQGPSEILSIK